MKQNYKHVFYSSITILKHPSIYQINHSQVLVIISVKITNCFFFFFFFFLNFFWFCMAHDVLNHSSAILLMYRFKHVPGNFRYWHTPHVIKSGWGKSTQRRKHNNNWICVIFLLQLFQNLLRGTKTVLMFSLNIVTLHDVIYIQNKGF